MKKFPRSTSTTTSCTPPASRTASRSQPPRTKKQIGIAMLKRQHGTTLVAMQKALGWQPHSVRGFLSTTGKSVTDYELVSNKPEGKPQRYRLVPFKEASS